MLNTYFYFESLLLIISAMKRAEKIERTSEFPFNQWPIGSRKHIHQIIFDILKDRKRNGRDCSPYVTAFADECRVLSLPSAIKHLFSSRPLGALKSLWDLSRYEFITITNKEFIENADASLVNVPEKASVANGLLPGDGEGVCGGRAERHPLFTVPPHK